MASALGDLLLVFQFHNHYFDRFSTGVDIGVHGPGRIGGEPVGSTGLPDVRFRRSVLRDDIHGAAAEGDDHARVIVPVHRQRLVWQHDGLPYLHVLILELGDALGLGSARLRVQDSKDSEG